jgi:hypothetical protein
MSHPYDASTKYLIEERLADWLPLTGRTSTAELQVINAELSTVTTAADRVLLVHEEPPWISHVELVASREPDLIFNLPAYNVLLVRKHRLLVRTVVVLLRKSAEWPELTGKFEQVFPGEPFHLEFRYRIVRVWKYPPETFLGGGLGILPLAPLSAAKEADLPEVIRRMGERFRREATFEEAGKLWTAADVLMGLRFPRESVAELLRGVHGMKESDTYQAILEEGRAEGETKGRIEGKIEFIHGLESLLNIPLSDVQALTAMDLKTLEAMASSLQEKLRNRLPA